MKALGNHIAQSDSGSISVVIDGNNNVINIKDKHCIPLQRPRNVEYFTGREQVLSELINDLISGKVITLCGPGGIGKSAIAAKAIWELAPINIPCERFPDGLLWHDFYIEPQSIKALENIAISYNEAPTSSPTEAVKRIMADKKALVLLDGAEEADNLFQIINVLSSCCILVTTRNKKDAYAKRIDVQALPLNQAEKLFQKWSNGIDDKIAVKKICKLTGRLPLAIRLAGRYIFETGEPINEFLADLEKIPLEVLNQGNRKHESIQVLIEKSLDQVSDNAIKILEIAGSLSFALFNKKLIQYAIPENLLIIIIVQLRFFMA